MPKVTVDESFLTNVFDTLEEDGHLPDVCDCALCTIMLQIEKIVGRPLTERRKSDRSVRASSRE